MSKKIAFLLVIIFCTQFIFSCVACLCNDPKSYLVDIKSIESHPKILNSELYPINVLDTISKADFLLVMALDADLERLAFSGNKSSVGFSSALACSCIDDGYQLSDLATGLHIISIDSEMNEDTITTSFSYYGNRIASQGSILNTINFTNQFMNEYRFFLESPQDIGNSQKFKIDLHFESGIILSGTTDVVNFLD